MVTYVLLQEDKWKREQAAAKEKQKAEEIKKQIIEEREHEELDALAHAAGIKQYASILLRVIEYRSQVCLPPGCPAAHGGSCVHSVEYSRA